jgi:7-carboxy-7-deazaguanine synthase
LQQTSTIYYPVMEHFYTIQGEGAFTGHASYFIRLGGCDVGCHWCDVKESWPIDTHPKLGIDELKSLVIAEKGKIAVITGGEPLMHNCLPLTESFQNAGIRTHIETSGAYEPSGKWDWFCLSPKKFKLPVANAYKNAHELKIIIFNKSDFSFAEEQLEKLIEHSPDNQLNTKLFLQPEWSKSQEMIPLIVAYVKANPAWKISLQTHKYLNIP